MNFKSPCEKCMFLWKGLYSKVTVRDANAKSTWILHNIYPRCTRFRIIRQTTFIQSLNSGSALVQGGDCGKISRNFHTDGRLANIQNKI